MSLENLEFLNPAFQVSVETYWSYDQNLFRRSWQKSITIFFGNLPFFSWFHKAESSKICTSLFSAPQPALISDYN